MDRKQTTAAPEAQYKGLPPTAEAFLRYLPVALAKEIYENNTRNKSKTRAFLANTTEHRDIDIAFLEKQQHHQGIADLGLLVVENINLDWIAFLADTLSCGLKFFVEHARSPDTQLPWTAAFGPKEFELRNAPSSIVNRLWQRSSKNELRDEAWHLDGVMKYPTLSRGTTKTRPFRMVNVIPRLLHFDNTYGWNASVRFSYILAGPNLHLILVDTPPSFSHPEPEHAYTRLFLPLSGNRGGLMVPTLLESSSSSIWDCFQNFVSHSWHARLFAGLQDAQMCISPAMLFYLLVTSTWQANMRALNSKLEYVAFNDIRRPSIQINDRLHDLRQYLSYLRRQVARARQWMPRSVPRDLELLKQVLPKGLLPSGEYVSDPAVRLDEILEQAKESEAFLMDSFQLLMSSISVLDAQTSLNQADRAQTLTLLAFIYVPLSFVTGIFGMNVKEVNGSPLSLWVPVVTLAITMGCTAIILWVMRAMRRRFAMSKEMTERHES